MAKEGFIVERNAAILVTGGAGFLGRRVVANLLQRRFHNLQCLLRPSSDRSGLEQIVAEVAPGANVRLIEGDLLNQSDAARAADGVEVVYHLAAGTGLKSHASAFLNSVVTTRNLMEALRDGGKFRRLVSLSSFSVYSNAGQGLLDEKSAIEPEPSTRAEAYCYAKVKQDAFIESYAQKHQLPYVLVRPGVIFGPGKAAIPGRVGMAISKYFLHLGGSSVLPLTYVDNCADAVVLAGLKPGIEGETFNVVDDHIPTSRQFLEAYKRNVKSFQSFYLPKPLSYLACFAWEDYCRRSHNQLPPAYTRREWMAYWKKTQYSNRKLKERLQWSPRVSIDEALQRYFAYCRQVEQRA